MNPTDNFSSVATEAATALTDAGAVATTIGTLAYYFFSFSLRPQESGVRLGKLVPISQSSSDTMGAATAGARGGWV